MLTTRFQSPDAALDGFEPDLQFESMSLRHGTTLTASEVAEQCGFVDASSFTQHFRKRMGESPAVYRRARR